MKDHYKSEQFVIVDHQHYANGYLIKPLTEKAHCGSLTSDSYMTLGRLEMN